MLSHAFGVERLLPPEHEDIKAYMAQAAQVVTVMRHLGNAWQDFLVPSVQQQLKSISVDRFAEALQARSQVPLPTREHFDKAFMAILTDDWTLDDCIGHIVQSEVHEVDEALDGMVAEEVAASSTGQLDNANFWDELVDKKLAKWRHRPSTRAASCCKQRWRLRSAVTSMLRSAPPEEEAGSGACWMAACLPQSRGTCIASWMACPGAWVKRLAPTKW